MNGEMSNIIMLAREGAKQLLAYPKQQLGEN